MTPLTIHFYIFTVKVIPHPLSVDNKNILARNRVKGQDRCLLFMAVTLNFNSCSFNKLIKTSPR